MNNLPELKLIKKARAEKILNQIQARESNNKRTIETRKKILLGAMLQEWVRTGEKHFRRSGTISHVSRLDPDTNRSISTTLDIYIIKSIMICGHCPPY